MSKSLNGMRVAILMEGTRGDAQPYVALALGIKKEGSVLRVLGCSDHEGLVKNQGFDFVPVFSDYQKQFDDPRHREAMKTGDTFKLLGAIGELAKVQFPDEFEKAWGGLVDFKPDVIIHGMAPTAIAEMYGAVHHIPTIPAYLGIYFVTGEVAPLGLRSTWSWVNRFLWNVLCKAALQNNLEKLDVAIEKLGRDDFKDKVPTTVAEFIDNFNDPLTPKLIGSSAHVYGVPKDVTCPNIEVTGWWILDSTHQVERFKAGDPEFGGKDKGIVDAFLQGGAPPIYIGWGSMIAGSPEFMANLAVSTLKQTKQRGILCKGWAGLAPEMLHNDELKAYAKDNVLFLKSAPHEWLLPQCVLSIIHGGSGTTASALRAGKPTIITPVFTDQFDFARSVNRLNVGVGTCQLTKITTDVLTGAVNKCLSDQEISRNAAKLGQQLEMEDGVGQAIGSLQRFVEGPLADGTWKRSVEERSTRWMNARRQSFFWCSGRCST